MRRQRPFAPLVSVVALALPLAACGSESAGDLTEVTVASLPNAFLAPLYVAAEDGTFEEEGLDVEIVELQSGADGVAAVVSGEAQFSDIGFDDLTTLAQEGESSLVMAHNLVGRVTLSLVMDSSTAQERGVTRDSPIEERYAALEGLTLGVTSPGAATDKYMRYYLREAGLDPERDAEIMAIGDGASLLAALETGQIDAYHLSPPTPYVAQDEGFGTLLIDGAAGDVPLFSDFVYTGFATNREWADDNPDAAEAFSRALNTGMESVQADPEAAGEVVAERMGAEDVDVVQQTVDSLLPALSEDGCFDPDAVETSLATMHDVEITESAGDPTEGELWTNDYNDC